MLSKVYSATMTPSRSLACRETAQANQTLGNTHPPSLVGHCITTALCAMGMPCSSRVWLLAA